ncbi:MAG: hypothetical protein H6865_04535 [Rhodospirillales bacterium]|nr:hypothetical protein [Alphaproteobacteria bacterium]MCB9986885.1 hypothetical protein [Rhodospirillales bacterium]USO08337.1 MAG: hypothetical protein H6866_03755 [Rhodospirillales bacterium]
MVKHRQQSGNVLFLILIAVALFAALSYAVTQSSRSGSDASKETNVINTASLTQYPNSVRTAVLRLIISGIDPLDIYFNRPDEFSGVGNTFFVGKESRGVFHPQGGGAAYQQIPANLTSGGTPIDWKFNADFEIPLLGLSQTGSGSGNELIAFGDGITQSICARVNKELHSDETIPVINTALTISNNRTATTAAPTNPTTETAVLTSDTPASPNWFSNKAFGCFQNGSSGSYVFYYVMAER